MARSQPSGAEKACLLQVVTLSRCCCEKAIAHGGKCSSGAETGARCRMRPPRPASTADGNELVVAVAFAVGEAAMKVGGDGAAAVVLNQSWYTGTLTKAGLASLPPWTSQLRPRNSEAVWSRSVVAASAPQDWDATWRDDGRNLAVADCRETTSCWMNLGSEQRSVSVVVAGIAA